MNKPITADEARKRVAASVESCGPGPLRLEKIVEAVASRLVEAYSEGYRTALLSRRNDYAAQICSRISSSIYIHGEDAYLNEKIAKRSVEQADALLKELSIERGN